MAQFTITLDYIADKFKEFNQTYFGGALRPCSFELMRTKRTLGIYRILQNRIGVSTYYDRSEVDYCNTILHEMIHAYIRQQGLKDTRRHHGKVFYEWADKINKQGGWHIARTDSVCGCGLTEKSGKIYQVATYINASGRAFLFTINPSYTRNFAQYFERNPHRFKDVVMFKSSDDKRFASFSACRTRISGHYISLEEHNKLKEQYSI